MSEGAGGDIGMGEPVARAGRNAKLLGGSILFIVALLVVAFTIWWLKGGARVCDEQLTKDGATVSVCRHLGLSDPPVLATAAVLLILLFIFLPVQEVSILGIGLKKQLEEAKEAAQSARKAAQSATEAKDAAAKAQQLAEGAEVATRRRNQEAIAVRNVSDGEVAAATSGLTGDDAMARLAHRYDENRKRPQHEPEQSNIVAEMAILVGRPGSDPAPFDPYLALTDDSMGMRVAGYVYFDQNVDAPKAAFEALIRAVQQEPEIHRNGQYLGLRAARRQVEAQPGIVSLQKRRALEELLSSVGPGTDRAYELRRILSMAEAKPGAP